MINKTKDTTVLPEDTENASRIEFYHLGLDDMKAVYRNLSAVYFAQQREIIKLRSIVSRVDDWLVTNWVAAKDDDYYTALNKAVEFCIQVEEAPSVNGGTIFLDGNECKILNRLLAGHIVGPTARKVITKLKQGQEEYEKYTGV